MNLLITGALKYSKSFFKDIEILGNTIIFQQIEKEELVCDYTWVEGVICNGLFLYHDITKFKNLKYIQLTSAGYDRVPMDYIKEKNITIYNAKGVYSVPMAEFALCGVLQLYKQSRFFYENQKKHIWMKNRELLELEGKNVCIVGCGSVGTECAKRFRAFGCRVIGIDILPYSNVNYDIIENISSLDMVLPDSDIIILTLPFSKQTHHLINAQKLKLLKKNAVLVNIARGAVLDTEALIEYMPKLKGAVLDVFEEEPLPGNSVLWNIDNLIVTPHSSFISENNLKRLNNLILKNIDN